MVPNVQLSHEHLKNWKNMTQSDTQPHPQTHTDTHRPPQAPTPTHPQNEHNDPPTDPHRPTHTQQFAKQAMAQGPCTLAHRESALCTWSWLDEWRMMFGWVTKSWMEWAGTCAGNWIFPFVAFSPSFFLFLSFSPSLALSLSLCLFVSWSKVIWIVSCLIFSCDNSWRNIEDWWVVSLVSVLTLINMYWTTHLPNIITVLRHNLSKPFNTFQLKKKDNWSYVLISYLLSKVMTTYDNWWWLIISYDDNSSYAMIPYDKLW